MMGPAPGIMPFAYVHTPNRYLFSVHVYAFVTYTETRDRNGKRYFYRTHSRRVDGKVKKQRIYLGRDLSPFLLKQLESRADLKLSDPEGLLKENELAEIDGILREFRKLPVETYRSRYEYFMIRFTHDSTAMEGNSFTLEDTRSLVLDGITPSSKKLKEVHEILDHRKAFDMILDQGVKMDMKWIFELHSRLVKNSRWPGDEERAGGYRDVNVGLMGSDVKFPAPGEVPELMKELLSGYRRSGRSLHPLVQAAKFHVDFEIIHPFSDGNGRLGRLLMNRILHSRGFPMINIPKRSKVEYFISLRRAHEEGGIRPFMELLLHLLQTRNSVL